MTALLLDPAAWIAFLTLTALELVLGIDNVIFISILVNRLPRRRRELARRIRKVPRVGSRLTERIEAPIVLVVIVVAARRVVARCVVAFTALQRLALGAAALALRPVASFARIA